MLFKLLQYKENFYTNFWVIPILMMLSAILLAVTMSYIDLSYVSALSDFKSLFVVSAIKEVLSIIAVSVVTITCVTFSITVLTLSIATNQFGPRLLPNFMRQKTTKYILGFFLGTFVYALMVLKLMTLSGSDKAYLSVSLAVIFGIASFFLFVYFIHYVCHNIQIDNILTFLIKDVKDSINRQLPPLNEPVEGHDTQSIRRLESQYLYKVMSEADGYMQTIDYTKLKKIALEHDLVIDVHFSPGKFMFINLCVMHAHARKPIEDVEAFKKDCIGTLQLGNRRTTVQDVEFAFEELSEVALLALSPGVNNPYTAIHCVDRMVEGFALLATKRMLPRGLVDEQGGLRVVRQVASYGDIISTALDRLRQQAAADLAVGMAILKMIGRILTVPMPQPMYDALASQGERTYEDLSKKAMNASDRSDLDSFYHEMKQARPHHD